MTYRLIRSRRRTVALEITREGKVVVRAPLRMPQRDIDAFVSSKERWLAEHLARQQTYRESHPPLTEEEKETLRRRAKAYLPGRVDYYAAVMGVTPTAVHITSARTRFGSCSGKNSISFSLYLMQYPAEAIDYVVVHELAHIRHHDHSPAFYAEVAKVMPDYRQRQALLRP
ncbi:MAG: M48 family metallopeptidase [Oscillospiraceae bacterium]|nr:M48 family metallopeptidase [Oscillospiraceae bacterium]